MNFLNGKMTRYMYTSVDIIVRFLFLKTVAKPHDNSSRREEYCKYELIEESFTGKYHTVRAMIFFFF